VGHLQADYGAEAAGEAAGDGGAPVGGGLSGREVEPEGSR
jgi:hypothetical protein